MASQKVVVVSTGGTIAMRYDPERESVLPALTGSELVEAVPPLADVCPLELVEFSNTPSPYITPPIMLKLSQKLDELLLAEDVAGAVVTHGTDTLEETAYLLDLTLQSSKPVCLTAAQRNAFAISPDGPKNILCAVQTAASPEARGKGVLVVMNEEIHAAREVTKTHTSLVDTFASPFWGPLGYVDEGRVIFRRQPLGLQKIRPAQLVEGVYLLKMAAGSDDLLLRCLVEKQVKGIVIEGLGRGNVPPAVLPGIELALRKNIPVVLTTRSMGGRVLDVYGYKGAAKSLKEMGVILAGEISGQKARLKLMLVLGITNKMEEIASYFDKP
ncbi:MAG: asparaginase [Firmicutes bacterium]|nr:asparaginase [Bacillota bacterium]